MAEPSAASRPNYEDVAAALGELCASHGDLCRLSVLGSSVDGREIPCVILSDPSASDDDKQRVLVVAGQHGTEESGRAMALELASWLVSGRDEAPEVLRRQTVAVIPCANPDGAVAETYRNADDVDVAHTYAIDSAALTPEGRALEDFAVVFAPEVGVDIHGRAGGGMKDVVWLAPPVSFTPDGHFLTVMAIEMCRAAEASGFPQCEVRPPGTLGRPEGNVLTLGQKLAAETKSLGFGIETIEHYYGETEWRADGLARLRRLLAYGMADEFGLGEAGYPASLVSGTRVYGLKAHGATAAERRESRVELTRFLRRNWAIVDREADGLAGCARVRVMSGTLEGKNPERFAVLLRFKKPCEIRSAEWEGTDLAPGEDHGTRVWEDGISLLLQANIAAPFGGPERFLVVRYDSPYLAGGGGSAGP